MRRSLVPLVFLCTGAVAVAACRPKKEDRPPDPAPTTQAAPLPPAPREAPKRACPAIDLAKIEPPSCESKVVKTAVPPIVDPDALGRFYDRVAELARGTAKRLVRIGMYGDSNLTSDFLSGHLRRKLQERFGDAGHGYVSLSKPWGSYRHEDVVHLGYWPMFKLYAPTTHIAKDKQYGFANMAAESNENGAAAWVATAKDPGAQVGRTASRFEIYYLKQPYGGHFTIQLDRKDLRVVKTRAEAFEAGFEVVETDDAPHEVRCVVQGNGPVRLFGTSLDRDVAGIQLDSLGAGALNYERLRWVADETRRAQLVRRDYDLVIIWLGTNVMWVPPNGGYAKEFIGQLRSAKADLPILIMGPGDTVKDDQKKSDPRIIKVVEQMRAVAAEEKTAFWDFREAMGGDASILGFTKRGLAGEDHIHFGPEGSHLMGNRFLCALFEGMKAHLAKNPDAGCPVEHAEPAERAAAPDAGSAPVVPVTPDTPSTAASPLR